MFGAWRAEGSKSRREQSLQKERTLLRLEAGQREVPKLRGKDSRDRHERVQTGAAEFRTLRGRGGGREPWRATGLLAQDG